jgi:hypothetical protein
MFVTVYYTVLEIEYIAQSQFTLLVQTPELIAVVNYPKLINVNNQNLVIDASESYDPNADSTNTAE